MRVSEVPKAAARYVGERQTWIAAGRPERSPERIKELYETACKPCPKFQPHRRNPDKGSCGMCGCRVNINGQMNKLRWATTRCPMTPPRFVEDMEPPMSRREKRRLAREARKEARARQAAKDEKRQRRAALAAQMPPPAELPENNDPLIVTDNLRRPTTALRNLWAPCSAFLVCGGPSLNQIDFGRLGERGILSLGINNVAAYVPVTAMVFSDSTKKFHHGCLFDGGLMKFCPQERLKNRLENRVRAKVDGKFRYTSLFVSQCPNVWGFHRGDVWMPEHFLTSDKASRGNGEDGVAINGRPKILFTFFLGLRLLHYLGVRKVYLLGADFRMGPGYKYAFSEESNTGTISGNNNHYRLAAEMLKELRPTLEKAGFFVYNCFEGSNLAAFPYVPFESALADCRGAVPEGALDTEDWYTED